MRRAGGDDDAVDDLADCLRRFCRVARMSESGAQALDPTPVGLGDRSDGGWERPAVHPTVVR